MLGKRGYYTRKSSGRTYKRRKLSSKSSGRSYRIRRDGNTRTGGLYRLRGGAPGTMGGRGRSIELKFFEKELELGHADTYASMNWINIAGDDTPARLSSNNWYQSGSFLTYLKQGTNANQRIGRKITLKSINFKGVAQIVQDAQTDITIAVWLVLDKQANGTPFTAADVFGKPASGAGGADGGQVPVTQIQAGPLIVASNYLIANSQRFQILGRKQFTLHNQIPFTAGAAGARGGAQGSINFYKKVNLQIEYGGPTGLINEIKSNNIGLICCATGNLNAAENEDNQPNYLIYGNMVLRYTDQ